MGRNEEVIDHVRAAMKDGWKDGKITNWLKDRGYVVTRHGVRQLMRSIEISQGGDVMTDERVQEVKCADNAMEATVICQARSLEALLDILDVDLDTWQVDRWIGNQWGKGNLWQVKAWFVRKTDEVLSLESLISDLTNKSPVVPRKFSYLDAGTRGRALEISVADPHFGMRCFPEASTHSYTPELAEEIYNESIALLLDRARPHGPFTKIIFVTGNDFMHADNVFHTTTAGTGQPEMDSWHHVFESAERVLISTVLGLTETAPVDVVMVPGNHARQSEFALGRIVNAYFRENENVRVDCSGAPYKFVKYGCNLLGYDHGHSIKPNRLGALMANENPQWWADTWNREWHCADQHRESAVFSEFGVQVRYLPSMVPANEWHRIKGFSHQHRASLGFVYDKDCGLISTPQVNFRELDCSIAMG